MKVSIITPSYNRAGLIETCLNSVMNQTHSNIEHIVVDGGSTDSTVELLKKYEKKYDLKWISEEDKGMYYAINKGLEIAKGDIIAYLNTDDAYFPWSVECAVKKIDKSVQIVFGDLLVITEIDMKKFFYLLFYKHFDIKHYTYFNTIAQPTVFFHKNVYEKIGGFDTSFHLLADCEYWLRCAKNNIIPMKINEVLAVQFDHSNALREIQNQLLKEEFVRLRSDTEYINQTANISGRCLLYFNRRIQKIKFYIYHLLNRGHGWDAFRQLLIDCEVRLSFLKLMFSLIPSSMNHKINHYERLPIKLCRKIHSKSSEQQNEYF